MIQKAINEWFILGGEGNAVFELIKDGYVFGTYPTLLSFVNAIEKYEFQKINVR